jgi:hypothetical protein
MIKNKISEYKLLISNKKYLWSVVVSIIFLILTLFIIYYAGTYATESASSPVTDVILSNTRAYDLDGAFVYGSFLFFFVLVFFLLNKPKSIPFVVKSVSLFYIIRSVFISLTHIGPFPSQIIIHSDILSKITFGGDLFFSGHTGLPFLIALIFWKDKIIRNIFLFFSLSFAIVVLLAHMHYSIDVLSAWFITYSIYHIALFIFRKDKLQWDPQ